MPWSWSFNSTAHTLLRIQYGRRWKHKAPTDLVWMPRTAPFAHEACIHINALANTPARTESIDGHTIKVNPEPYDSADQLERVMQINERHWAHAAGWTALSTDG